MEKKSVFTKNDIGCFFDGARGIYIGECVQKLAKENGWTGVSVSITDEFYMDAWVEAEDFLQSLCDDDVCFMSDDGFYLIAMEEQCA